MAGRFTTSQWMPLGGLRQPCLQILLAPGDGRTFGGDLVGPAKHVLDYACQTLGIPVPLVKVEAQPELEPGEFLVLLDDAPRLLGRFDQSFESWWTSHPVGGRFGRTGLARPDQERLTPAALVARGVEEVLWEDPGLLWSRAAALHCAVCQSTSQAPTKDRLAVSDSLRTLLSRRIPLTRLASLDQSELRILRDSLSAGDASLLEKEASKLLPADIVVRTGATLTPSAPQIETLARSVQGNIALELGMTFPRVRHEAAGDLGDDEYQILINGLPRATSNIPMNRRFVKHSKPIPPALQPIPWVSPVNGWRGVWVLDPGGELPDTEGSWDPVGFIGFHLAACLREAAAEFCDLGWVHQTLDSLAQTHEEAVQLAREHLGDEQIVAVLRGLLGEGVSIAPLLLILEYLLEYDLLPPATLCLDQEEFRGRLKWATSAPATLIEYARAGLKQELTYRQARGTGTLHAFILSPDLEARLRQVLADPVARGTSARPLVISFLRDFCRQVRSRPTADPPTVLAPVDLRALVHRLVAAQEPLASVLSFNDLMASTTIVPIQRIHA